MTKKELTKIITDMFEREHLNYADIDKQILLSAIDDYIMTIINVVSEIPALNKNETDIKNKIIDYITNN